MAGPVGMHSLSKNHARLFSEYDTNQELGPEKQASAQPSELVHLRMRKALALSIFEPAYLGSGLGTSKSTKTARGPSEATPAKRDMIFDLTSHNPKVVGSNLTPATIF